MDESVEDFVPVGPELVLISVGDVLALVGLVGDVVDVVVVVVVVPVVLPPAATAALDVPTEVAVLFTGVTALTPVVPDVQTPFAPKVYEALLMVMVWLAVILPSLPR